MGRIREKTDAIILTLYACVCCVDRSWPHPPVETNSPVAAGKDPAEDGPLFAIQRYDPDATHVFLHPRRSLAGVHLVRGRREGEAVERQGLGSW